MKKLTAVLLACVMLFSVAFALPMSFSVMPRTGFFNSQVDVDAGETWTSYKYEIPSSYPYVYMDADLVGGKTVKVELYGTNSTSSSGTKLGTLTVSGFNHGLSATNSYTYYYMKVINNSGTDSAVVVMLYA